MQVKKEGTLYGSDDKRDDAVDTAHGLEQETTGRFQGRSAEAQKAGKIIWKRKQFISAARTGVKMKKK